MDQLLNEIKIYCFLTSEPCLIRFCSTNLFFKNSNFYRDSLKPLLPFHKVRWGFSKRGKPVEKHDNLYLLIFTMSLFLMREETLLCILYLYLYFSDDAITIPSLVCLQWCLPEHRGGHCRRSQPPAHPLKIFRSLAL